MAKHSKKIPAQNIRVSAAAKAKQTIVSRAEKQFADLENQAGFETLAEAQDIYPDDVNIAFLVGKYTAKHKQLGAGIKKLEAVLERDPKHVKTLMELGNIYLRAGAIGQANPYFRRALDAAPKNPGCHAGMGALHQRKGDLPSAVEAFRQALQLQTKNPKVEVKVPEKKPFRTVDAEQMLWDTLKLMADNGVHMFPVFGTLLGLVRDGQLMEHDKDVDTGIPFSEMKRAIRILEHHGWKEVHRSFGYMNPRALVNQKMKLSMDISGFVIDSDTKNALTAGAWFPGVPKEWNLIFEFEQLRLKKKQVPDGSGMAWQMENPEPWLEMVYGKGWKTPDKHFDTMICGKNAHGFPLLMQCFAYSRILEHWTGGNKPRAMALVKHTLARDPRDALIRKVQAKLRSST